jgi:hypothetical protein
VSLDVKGLDIPRPTLDTACCGNQKGKKPTCSGFKLQIANCRTKTLKATQHQSMLVSIWLSDRLGAMPKRNLVLAEDCAGLGPLKESCKLPD